MEALNAEGAKAAHAESFFFNCLLAICLGVLYFVEASFRIYLCHDIFSSPLFKAKVVKIDNEANGEFHNGWGLTGMRLMQGQWEAKKTPDLLAFLDGTLCSE